jgi:O-antigen ligase
MADGPGRLPFWSVLRGRAIYLWVALATPAVVAFTQYSLGGQVVFKGHTAAVLLGVVGTTLAVVLWLPYRRPTRWPALATAALLLMVATWAYQAIRMFQEGAQANFTTFAVPIVLVLIAWKPPSMEDVRIGLAVFAYSVIFVSALSIVLDLADLAPSAFIAAKNGVGRIPLLSDLFGIDTRWEGPFQHSNYAGPIGGSLILIGASFRGGNRVAMVAGGGVILLLSQSRTAFVATCFGLLVVVLFATPMRGLRYRKAVRWTALLAVITLVSAYIVAFDPTLAWRTYAWQDFFALWRESPWLGVGDARVTEYFVNGTVNGTMAFTHAHNIVLDPMTRYGIPMLVLIVGILALTAILAARALRLGQTLGASVTSFLIVLGLTETPFSWSYLSPLMVPLIIAVMVSAAAFQEVDAESPPWEGDRAPTA